MPRPTPAPVYAAPEARAGAADAKASLRRPPPTAVAKACRAAEPPEPLARDWTVWSGGDTGVDPPRALADAARLIQGGGDVLRDKPLARRLLENLAATPGPVSARAKRELALLLVDPEAGAPDAARARSLLEAALAEREPTAALSLGRLMRDARLPGSSPALAARFFSIAASFGDPRAGLEFATLFTAGDTPEPFAGAKEQYLTLALIGAQTAVQQGDCTIVADVGDLLLGPPGREDVSAALPWYEFGDRIDDPVSEMKLANLYAAGLGVPRDSNKALALDEAAAAHGSVEAMARAAARHFEEGRSIPKGMALAEKAAANRSPAALRLIARFQRGDFTGKADFPAMNGTLDRALAMPGAGALLLADKADALLKGRGTSVDKAAATAIFERIAAIGTPEADFEYGTFLLKEGGDRAERDRRLLRAAEGGYALAMLEVSDNLRCEGTPGEEQAAQGWLTRAASAGSSAAMRRIGQAAADLGRVEEARTWLGRAAEAGDRLSMVELAKLAPSPEQRAGWIERASAEGGDVVEGRLALARAALGNEIALPPAEAERLLGTLGSSGDDRVDFEIARSALAAATPGDAAWTEAVTRMNRSARSGNPKAMTFLARLGGSRDGPTQRSADQWMRDAALAGDPQALATIRTGTEAADILPALEPRRICDPAALVQMARLSRELPDGKGAEAAARLLERATRLAGERARDLASVGDAYASGLATGTPDPKTAERLLAEAARRGSQRAAVSLARVVADDGTQGRYAEALGLLRGAALAREPAAVKTLASLADERAGQGEDFERTLALLRELSDGGDPEAMYAYGSILGTYDDARRADGIAYLERAAAARHVGAMKALAQLYAAGLSDEASAGKSTRWTKAAAELGDPEAMFRYALALDIGFGVPQDHAAANSWHERARDNGFVN